MRIQLLLLLVLVNVARLRWLSWHVVFHDFSSLWMILCRRQLNLGKKSLHSRCRLASCDSLSSSRRSWKQGQQSIAGDTMHCHMRPSSSRYIVSKITSSQYSQLLYYHRLAAVSCQTATKACQLAGPTLQAIERHLPFGHRQAQPCLELCAKVRAEVNKIRPSASSFLTLFFLAHLGVLTLLVS